MKNTTTKPFKSSYTRFYAYWNLLKRATNPKVRKNVGPPKKDDGTMEFTDSGKANLMNSYFATIGLKLSLPPPTSCRYGKTCADKGETDSPRLTDAYVSKSLVQCGEIKGAKNKKIHGFL